MIKHLFKPMADADRFIGLFLWLNYPDITSRQPDIEMLWYLYTFNHEALHNSLTLKHYPIVQPWSTTQ